MTSKLQPSFASSMNESSHTIRVFSYHSISKQSPLLPATYEVTTQVQLPSDQQCPLLLSMDICLKTSQS